MLGDNELNTMSNLGDTTDLPDPHSLIEIWDGMNGPIWIIHSAWNKNRAEFEVIKGLDDEKSEEGEKLRKKGITEEMVEAVFEYISRYGDQFVEGDILARDHIIRILRNFYNSELINFINSWNFGSTIQKIEQNKFFQEIIQENVILICGPLGNLASDIFLRHANLRWLFPGEKQSCRNIRRWPDDSEQLRPKGSPPNLLEGDIGVFFRTSNPFNKKKRLYAAMGAYAWGTKGAAALACSARSATEMILANKYKKKCPVDYGAWIQIEPSIKKTNKYFSSFNDPENYFQIVWPKDPSGCEWSKHLNPASIDKSEKSLSRWLLRKSSPDIIFLPIKASSLLGFSVSLLMLMLACLTLALGKINCSLGIPWAIISIGSGMFFGLQLLAPRFKLNSQSKLYIEKNNSTSKQQ